MVDIVPNLLETLSNLLPELKLSSVLRATDREQGVDSIEQSDVKFDVILLRKSEALARTGHPRESVSNPSEIYTNLSIRVILPGIMPKRERLGEPVVIQLDDCKFYSPSMEFVQFFPALLTIIDELEALDNESSSSSDESDGFIDYEGAFVILGTSMIDERIAAERATRRLARRRQKNEDIFQLYPRHLRIFFRFEESEIRRLLHCFRVPETIHLSNGSKVPGMRALLMLLARLAHPSRTALQAETLFGVHESVMSRTVRYMTRHILGLFSHKLRLTSVPRARLESYATTLERSGVPIQGCIGFIDGTLISVARPKRDDDQRSLYNGHKKTHAIKFQVLTAPDGLMVDVYGGSAGSRHDITMYRLSGLAERLTEADVTAYGDSGYVGADVIRFAVRNPRNGQMHHSDQARNSTMSSFRIAVEWSIGIFKKSYHISHYAKMLRSTQDNVSELITMAILLSNCLSCIRPNQISVKYGLLPPSLEEYLQI